MNTCIPPNHWPTQPQLPSEPEMTGVGSAALTCRKFQGSLGICHWFGVTYIAMCRFMLKRKGFLEFFSFAKFYYGSYISLVDSAFWWGRKREVGVVEVVLNVQCMMQICEIFVAVKKITQNWSNFSPIPTIPDPSPQPGYSHNFGRPLAPDNFLSRPLTWKSRWQRLSNSDPRYFLKQLIFT